jgi:hypothetical protein
MVHVAGTTTTRRGRAHSEAEFSLGPLPLLGCVQDCYDMVDGIIHAGTHRVVYWIMRVSLQDTGEASQKHRAVFVFEASAAAAAAAATTLGSPG